MERPYDFDVHKIINHCQGTCTETIQSALDLHYEGMTEDQLTPEDFQEIDNHIFNCPMCGWWVEVDEMSAKQNELGEDVCESCLSSDEEE